MPGQAAIIDVITAAFVGAIQAGMSALSSYSLPLLGAFALIAFYVQLGPVLASGAGSAGDAVAGVLLVTIKIGIFYWLMVNLVALVDASFLTFLQWGVTPAGGRISAQTFQNPSIVLDLGFRIGAPIRDYTDRFVHWLAVWNWPVLLAYSLAYYAIVIGFMFIALHLMMTIIEFYLSAMVATVLIPFGVLQPTAFFTEFSIGWVTGGLIRVLLTAGLVGIALPLFDLVVFNKTAGGDPTFYSAMVCGLTSVIFAILCWVIPARAAVIAGRGVSLALHGGTVVSGIASGARGILTMSGAVQGTSRFLRGGK
jgi:type IV secretory pathway TrbL component